MKRVYVIGTCDTKGEELQYACQCVRRTGAGAVLVDVSTTPSQSVADVKPETVAACHPEGKTAVLGLTDRGEAVTAMGVALSHYMLARKDVGAVLGLGGSGNTAIVTEAMRALPIGVPKLMVSTLASGNVAGFVGPADIAMMHSVVDVAGLNSVSRRVIANAAHAVAGMVLHEPPYAAKAARAIGFTMFGVTTPCITAIRKHFEPRHECFVFHATGTGGQSFEKLGGLRLPRRGLRHDDDRSGGPSVRRHPALHGRPFRRLHPPACSLCRLGWRCRHGQLRGARNRARKIQGPAVSHPQRACDADAHNAGGERCNRRGSSSNG